MTNIGKWLQNNLGNMTIGPVKTRSYTIDGRKYESLDEMPESDRQRIEAHFELFEDSDSDGTPDIFQNGDNTTTSRHSTKRWSYIVDNSDKREAAEILKDELLYGGYIKEKAKRREPDGVTTGRSVKGDNEENKTLKSQKLWNRVFIFTLFVVIILSLFK